MRDLNNIICVVPTHTGITSIYMKMYFTCIFLVNTVVYDSRQVEAIVNTNLILFR